MRFALAADQTFIRPWREQIEAALKRFPNVIGTGKRQ
jgi:hypothetical protein